ncbi:MAG: TM2 domain-containing protein [Burkholderiaceae bacterium]
MKNKTFATVLALLGGPFGLHRFYLHGWRDGWGWFLPVPTLVGVAGVMRTRQFGNDDQLGWLLAPWLGFVIAACALTAIVYGLSSAERWNRHHNPAASPDAVPGTTNWLTIVTVVLALLLGTTALMSALALTFQHFFEYQNLTTS